MEECGVEKLLGGGATELVHDSRIPSPKTVYAERKKRKTRENEVLMKRSPHL